VADTYYLLYIDILLPGNPVRKTRRYQTEVKKSREGLRLTTFSTSLHEAQQHFGRLLKARSPDLRY